jgi:serine/threonine protein kinase
MPVAAGGVDLERDPQGPRVRAQAPDSETGRTLGIVHRDISPPNILVSWNGEVKLTDFGLAKATTQLESTDPGVVKGKYSYLSPEAARGEEIDHRADLFSTGILAFEMLTGRRLFRGKNDYQTIALVRACDVPSVRSYNPSVPRTSRRC